MRRPVLALALACPGLALAVPLQINHQGRLVDDQDRPVDGLHTLRVALYAGPTGGSPVWSDSHDVVLERGYYSLILGNSVGNPLDSSLFDRDLLYLGLAIDSGAEFPTRQQVVSVPFARRAEIAGGVSGGIVDATEIRIGGEVVVDGRGVFVGETPPDSFSQLGASCVDGAIPVYNGVQGRWVCGVDRTLNGVEVRTHVSAAPVDLAPLSTLGGLQFQTGEHTWATLPDAPEDLIRLGSLSTECDGGDVIAWDVLAGAWGCAQDAVLTGEEVVAHVQQAVLNLGAGSTVENQPIAVGPHYSDDDVVAVIARGLPASALPFDGLDDVSNGVFTNELYEDFESPGAVAIPSASAAGVTSAITVPSIGNPQYVQISVSIQHADVSRLAVRLEDPDGVTYGLLAAGGASGTRYDARFPVPNPPSTGDLTRWNGRDPAGVWTLRVIDAGGSAGSAGELLSWGVHAFATSSNRAAVAGRLEVSDALTVDAAAWLLGDVLVGGTLTVLGEATMSSLLVAESGLVVSGEALVEALAASGLIEASGGLEVSGGALVDELVVTGEALVEALTASGLLTAEGGLIVTGEALVEALTASGLLTAEAGLTVQGATSVQSLAASGPVTAGAGLGVTGTTTTDGLVVNGSVSFPDGQGLVPRGALMAFNLDACPVGWAAANGSGGTPNMAGRFPIGAGAMFQDSGVVIARGSSGGSHRWRIGHLRYIEEFAEGSEDHAGLAVGFEFQGETQRTASGGANAWSWSDWTHHLPPYYGVLYCVKV